MQAGTTKIIRCVCVQVTGILQQTFQAGHVAIQGCHMNCQHAKVSTSERSGVYVHSNTPEIYVPYNTPKAVGLLSHINKLTLCQIQRRLHRSIYSIINSMKTNNVLHQIF